MSTTNTTIKNVGNASTSSTSSATQQVLPKQEQPQVSPKKGFRQASVSMLKALSPTAKNKKSNQGIPATKSSMSDLFKKSKVATDAAPGPISYQTAEAERSASMHPSDNDVSTDLQTTTKAVVDNVPDGEGSDNKQMSPERDAAANPSELSKEDAVADAYIDDNDGGLGGHCNCEGCIIL